MEGKTLQGPGRVILPKECLDQSITLRKPRELQDVKDDNTLETSNPKCEGDETHCLISDSEPDTEKLTSTKQHQLSVDAREFVPQSQLVSVPCDNDESYHFEFVDYLNEVLTELSANPGYYNYIAENLMSTMNHSGPVDNEQISIVIQCILQQAIYEPNFRYNGARLCNELSRNLQVEGSSFRALLLNNCREIVIQRQDIIAKDPDYFQGFALFMSELFLNLTIGSETSSNRIEVLSDAIIDVLETLLSHTSFTSIKCLCQMLKLTGAVIEDTEKTRNVAPFKLNKIIASVQKVVQTNDIPPDLKEMLRNILELQANDWGRSVVSHSTGYPSHHAYEEEGIAYGPDGPIFTTEEAAFLETNTEETCDDGGIWDYDGGLDDEMAEAFEEFLKIQNKASAKTNK